MFLRNSLKSIKNFPVNTRPSTAMTTHALRSSTVISTNGPDVTSEFEKSGEHPLDISIVDEGEGEKASSYAKAIELVKENFQRVRSLQVRSVKHEFLDSVLSPYTTKGVGAPLLEELVIAAPEGRESEELNVSPSILEHLFHPSPHLTHLTLPTIDNVPPSSFIFHHVTHFTIDRGLDANPMIISDYVEVVRALAPKLRSLSYVGYDLFSYQAITIDKRSIDAPELTRLDMWAPSPGFEIVPYLNLPKLEEVRLTDDRPEDYAEDWNDKEYTPMTDVLKALRADCPLRRVELVNLRCLDPQTYKVFLQPASKGDTLESLSIHKGGLTDEQLNGATLAPTLKRLELHDVAGITSAALKSFIQRSLEERSNPIEIIVAGQVGAQARELEGLEGAKVIIRSRQVSPRSILIPHAHETL
jgi:hypothetical protein